MTRSANEVMTLAAKAARGAGAPPGQAATFGRAVVPHLIAGRNIEALTAALDALPMGPILDLPQAFAQLAEAANGAIADGSLPPQDLVLSYVEALPFHCAASSEPHATRITIDVSKPATQKTLCRITLPDDFIHRLEAFAAKTMVPESEASRLSGAGAGLTDND